MCSRNPAISCGYVGKWHMGDDAKPGHGYQYTYTMIGGSRSYTDPEMSLNGQMVQEKGYLADLMTQRACEFLDKQSGITAVLSDHRLSESTHAVRRSSAEVLRHVRQHRFRYGRLGRSLRRMRYARKTC